MTQPRKQVLFFLLGLAGACLLLAVPAAAQTQSNAADLQGVVSDPTGARVPGATVTVRNLATNLERSTTSDAAGVYRVLALPPGRYEVVVDAPGFATVRNPALELLIGSVANYDIHLEVRAGQETVVVTTEAALIETQRTAVTETITSRDIQNLPINQRDYLNFTLLASNAARDSAPSIGAAPTSGLNFGGQRARSNQVSVDGADATDNSTNGVRATVSQEAVQEFQIITNSYMAEFGRASGAIVNIVTKGGSNEVHGNVFGFLRNKRFQARNPFSTVDDPAFTRLQAGFTIGGPLKQDRSFYFFSFETRRRQEEGFSSIGADNFGLVPFATPLGSLLVTPAQLSFLNDPLASAFLGPIDFLDGFPNTNLENYLFLAAGGSGVALTGINPFLGGPFFPPLSLTGVVPLPSSFVQLNALRGNYPVEEDTNFISARIDHRWNNNNSFFVRGSVTPSDVTGIQVNAQNQSFGQNAFSRSSEQSVRDWAVVAQNVTTLGNSWVNEARFQIARRGLSYTPSNFAGGPGEPLGGSGLGVDIGGFAHFGREPFSRVDRVERRYQWTDNVSYLRGSHTFKFGADINFIEIGPRFSNNQVFELNFGGSMRFGALSETSLQFPDVITVPGVGTLDIPGFSSVQAYGIGLPSSFIQGIGDSFSAFNNTAIAFYAQDSWRIRSNFTLNYGVRWEGEATPQLPAFNDVTAQAEAFLGVTEGIRRDWDNVAPRIGLAWDPGNDGKTVIRAAYGLFYDHPLLAIAFNADTADGAQSTQQILGGGAPCVPATSILVNPGCLNATNVFQGILDTSLGAISDPFNFGYQSNQQRFDPFTPNSIFINQNFCPSSDATRQCAGGFPLAILPWTLPIEENFEFGYAQQWNLTVERELVHDLSLSVSYQGVKGAHLNRPRNINPANGALLVANANAAFLAGLFPPGFTPLGIQVPGIDPSTGLPFAPGACVDTSLGGSILLSIPGIFGTGFGAPSCAGAPVGAIGTAAAFNFFRATGPNLALTGGLGIPDAAILGVAAAAGYPLGPGFFVPFSDVNQQESSGASIYHALTVNLRKRYGNHYQFLASYTWSHAIDDSTDLQTLLNPQDNRRPDLERGNSTFDLRHRFVFSAVFESPFSRNDAGAWRKVFADFVIAPIFEASSGRPFSVLTGRDSNLDFSPFSDRPTVVPVGTAGSFTSPFLEGVAFAPPTVCPSTSTALTGSDGCTGTLGRNTFQRPMTWNLDLRVARKIHFDERWNLELIADMFNLFNRFNVGDVNQLCDPIGGRCIAGQPTAALDARQFQFGVKLSW